MVLSLLVLLRLQLTTFLFMDFVLLGCQRDVHPVMLTMVLLEASSEPISPSFALGDVPNQAILRHFVGFVEGADHLGRVEAPHTVWGSFFQKLINCESIFNRFCKI